MLKKSLLVFTVLGIAGSAAAADITNPFYLAQKGQVGSITSVSYDRSIVKSNRAGYWSKGYNAVADEQIQYGLNNSVALIGSIGNTWNHWKARSVIEQQAGNTPGPAMVSTPLQHDDENINWSAGLAWNVLSGPAKLQLSGKYGQDRLGNLRGEYKYAAGEIKAGYQFQRVLPYVSGGVNIPVAQPKVGNKLTYNAKAGLYQGACEVWALDTGIRMTYDENMEARLIDAEAEASYYLTKNSTIGVFGTYRLDGKAQQKTKLYDKSVGARLRIFF